MNQRERFLRKIAYAVAIAILLLPLSWLSQPETRDSEGGLLARMRTENQLSQAALGEIDPASETIKLVTLGMRGVAANILWEKANYYKRTEDWTSMSAALEQIARLQPNFISVWTYQGWNLSYNISVEFDDYHDRYFWVIKGINFLKEGTKYNVNDPSLLSTIGETIGRKIGKSDEHEQFRRLFREDDEFNGARPRAQRDSWLVARDWLLEAENLVDQKGVPVKGKSPLLFYLQPPLFLMYYGEAIEEEGTFGEMAKSAWKKAADSWTEYGQRDLPTQYNFTVRLADKDLYEKRSKDAQEELTRLAPQGIRDRLRKDKIATLPKEERDALEMSAELRTEEQRMSAMMADDKVRVSHREVADQVAGEDHAAALRLAEEATMADVVARAIGNDRDIVNYNYWTLRATIEPHDDTLFARKSIYEGDKAFAAAKLVDSKRSYEEGIAKWRQVIDAYPGLLQDGGLTQELFDSIKHYQSVLHQLDEKFPQPFALQDVLDAEERFHGTKFNPTPGASLGTTPDTEPESQ